MWPRFRHMERYNSQARSSVLSVGPVGRSPCKYRLTGNSVSGLQSQKAPATIEVVPGGLSHLRVVGSVIRYSERAGRPAAIRVGPGRHAIRIVVPPRAVQARRVVAGAEPADSLGTAASRSSTENLLVAFRNGRPTRAANPSALRRKQQRRESDETSPASRVPWSYCRHRKR